MNPQHTVPTLEDDGYFLWDSHAINAYLIGKYAKDDSLYPEDFKKRGTVDERLHFDNGVLYTRLLDLAVSTTDTVNTIIYIHKSIHLP